MKSAFFALAACLTLCLNQHAFSQSWLGFNAAVPKVAPGYGGSVSVTSPGVAIAPPGIPTNSPVAPTLVPTTRPWKLGVVVRNTDIGAVVQSVEPDSPAQSFGIIPGDTIVAVSGTRIGEFDGRVVDIGEEIKRYADSSGRVPLLIQNSRTLGLKASVVTLSSTASALSGSALLADQSSLPSGSVLTVQLQNITRPFYEVAGGKAVLKTEGQGPFRFDLFLDPRYLSPSDQYQLSAFVTLNNQIIYYLRQPILVPIQGLNQIYNLSLERVAMAPAPPTTPGVVTSALPATPSLPGQFNTDAMSQVFVSLLGRQPTSRELIAWQDYMQQGHTLNDVAAKIMASPQFRERYATDQAYVQQVIQTLTGKLATSNDVAYWVSRLQSLGAPDRMIAELTSQTR